MNGTPVAINGETLSGLAIVKHIMEAHGGEVDVESSLGEGASFRMIFPVTPPAA